MAFTIPPEQFSQEHWDWVRDLIRDLEREQQCDEFLKRLFQWDMGVKQFRKIEMARMILGDPNESDFHSHAACLHALLAIGHSLILEAEEFDGKELAHESVQHAQISAYVEELEQSFREWHHGFNKTEIEEAQRKIFGAAS